MFFHFYALRIQKYKKSAHFQQHIKKAKYNKQKKGYQMTSLFLFNPTFMDGLKKLNCLNCCQKMAHRNYRRIRRHSSR